MTDPRITKEMIEAAAMRMAQLELPDSHTLDDRLNAPWYRHTWQAEQVLEAAFEVLGAAPTVSLAEHDAQVWDQGWVSAMQYESRCQDAEAAGQGVLITKPKNPYRAEAARLREEAGR